MKGLKKALIDTLMKGAMKRIAPVAIEDRKPYRLPQEVWQSEVDSSGRNELSDLGMDDNNRKRALHKLSGVTQTRRHPETGEREFLLHRGISPKEKNSMFDRTGKKPQSKYDAPTSFTPNIAVASGFSTKYRSRGAENMISAWIPESQISNIPKQYGSYNATAMQLRYGPNFKGHGKNKYSAEHEVIVKPHPLNLVHRDEVSKLTGMDRESASHGVFSLDQAINSRVHANDRPDIARTYASVREPKKLAASELKGSKAVMLKSLLAKAPAPYFPQNEFKQGPVTDLVDIPDYNKKQTTLPNGLIYQTSKHHPNSGRTHHHLFHPDFKAPIAAAISDYSEGEDGHTHQIKASRVSSKMKGKGYGKALYSAILEHHIPENHKLHSDTSISPEANSLWSSFKGMSGIGGFKAAYPKDPKKYEHSDETQRDPIYDHSTHHIYVKNKNELNHAEMYRPIQRFPKKAKTVAPKQDSDLPLFGGKLAASETLAKAEGQAPKVNLNPAHGKIIADAYGQMKHDPNHPEVKAAYGALINETKKQFQDMLNSGFKISKIKEGQENPYPTSKHLHADVDNGHMWYFPTEQGFGSGDEIHKDHPMLQPTEFNHGGKPMLANDLFRVVHDRIHHKLRNGFGPKGEHESFLEHKKMYSPLAQKALASETMGQNSFVNFSNEIGHLNQQKPGSAYAPQKAGLMPDHIINGKWHE